MWPAWHNDFCMACFHVLFFCTFTLSEWINGWMTAWFGLAGYSSILERSKVGLGVLFQALCNCLEICHICQSSLCEKYVTSFPEREDRFNFNRSRKTFNFLCLLIDFVTNSRTTDHKYKTYVSPYLEFLFVRWQLTFEKKRSVGIQFHVPFFSLNNSAFDIGSDLVSVHVLCDMAFVIFGLFCG